MLNHSNSIDLTIAAVHVGKTDFSHAAWIIAEFPVGRTRVLYVHHNPDQKI